MRDPPELTHLHTWHCALCSVTCRVAMHTVSKARKHGSAKYSEAHLNWYPCWKKVPLKTAMPFQQQLTGKGRPFWSRAREYWCKTNGLEFAKGMPAMSLETQLS